MTLQVENLRQTYDRTFDNLMTNRKIFLVIWPQDRPVRFTQNTANKTYEGLGTIK